ncbi:hypothetical protein TREPR_0876 [Treponema primitia ZAS-2]|uniref:Uncharacterized protein n=1 Tax=Treponema primitia (strain ATCC BAA-887 / DSM 12427 / ZAS-2) TaxID=545694 RepID=F5YIM0_TREPZ|nr:hypothetical protein TREPR_0876 [Treponema primitia ZAS-2]
MSSSEEFTREAISTVSYIQENIRGLVDYDNFTRWIYSRQKLLT